MEDNDRLRPPKWDDFKPPPKNAKCADEILDSFYAALKTRPPASLECILNLFGPSQSLELIGFNGDNESTSSPEMHFMYTPFNQLEGFNSGERACIVNAVKSCPYLGSLGIALGDSIDRTVIAEILSGPSPLRELHLSWSWFQDDEAEVSMVVESIQRIETLETLSLYAMQLDEILLRLFPSASTSEGCNILKTLRIRSLGCFRGIGPAEYEAIANMLRTDSKLMTLDMSSTIFTSEEWLVIFEALKVNSHLKKLDMKDSHFSKTAAQKVLGGIKDLLHVNYSLQEIDLSGTKLEKDGSYERVEAQLKKNASMHRDALTGMAMMKPKVARVFLCGFPFAGKTQLRKTMAAESGFVFRAKQHLKGLLPHSSLERTTGIEVEVIENGDVRLSLWDLGGQDEYHAFHDLLIPNVNGYESACSFVILCSPVARDDSNRIKEVRFKDQKAVERELDYWLRFISSNSTISEAFKPHVTLVFTHDDHVHKDHDIQASLEDIVRVLKEKFQDSLQISPETFFVNGKMKQSVKPLATFLEENVREILKVCPDIYHVCEQTESALARWNMDNPQRPLIKWEGFVNLCKRSFGGEGGEHFQNICKAIALALHDTGDVIYFEKLRYVVVNPNWFCHDIMGTILSLDEMCRTISRKRPITDERGFLTKKVLKSLLDGSYVDGSILSKKTKKVEGVLAEDLIEVMVEMNLCFEDLRENGRESNGGLFIPATLRDKCRHGADGYKNVQWQRHSDRAHVYIGRRLECEDGDRTFLTQGFFPRVQVFFKKRFPSSVNCVLEQNMISLRVDGKQVVVEYCGESQSTASYDHMDGYIDILVKSSKSMGETLAFTKEHVLKLITEVCYSPTFGCPGVKLVESILNPRCVEELWSMQNRKDQVVRVENLIADVMSLSNSEYIPNSDYFHEWPSPGANDKAQDLLGDVWQDLLNQRYKELEGYHVTFMGTIVVEGDDNEDEEEPRNFGAICMSDEAGLDPQHAIVYESIKATGRAVIEHMDQHHKEVIQRMDVLESNMSKKMDDIITLQRSLLPALSRNIDKMVNFSIHLQQRRVPRLMYLTTKDVGTCERLITSLTPDVTCAQLHFMCEHTRGIHRVGGQEGYTVILAGDAALRARPYVIWGLRVISLLAKIGGLAVAGMGSLIGDVEKSLLEGLANAIPINTISSSFGEECLPRKLAPLSLNSPVGAEDEGHVAEQWLVDTLQGKDIRTLFDLHRIRYKNGRNEVAWVCGKHKVEGCVAKTMEILPV